MTAVLRRELKAFFCRLSSYIVLGLFVASVGLFMLLYNFFYGNTGFEYAMSMVCVSFALLLPLAVIPLFAQERRCKLDRFLGMLPISSRDLVMGKYLAMVSILGILTIALLICPLILNAYAQVHFPTSLSALAAFFLMSLTWLSIDCFLALMIRSRWLLWVLSYAIPALMIGVGYLTQFVSHGMATVLNYLSIFGGYTFFGLGIFDIRATVIWCSVTAVLVVCMIRFSDRICRSWEVAV